jgi:hypothetical protein
MTCCPHCHQPILDERLGVRLTPLKAAIVDKIKAAGDVGISSIELMHDLWPQDAVVLETVRAHVWQINSVLEETDWRIRSDGRRWFLVREQHV